jgi:hypothetical protein
MHALRIVYQTAKSAVGRPMNSREGRRHSRIQHLKFGIHCTVLYELHTKYNWFTRELLQIANEFLLFRAFATAVLRILYTVASQSTNCDRLLDRNEARYALTRTFSRPSVHKHAYLTFESGFTIQNFAQSSVQNLAQME